MATKHHRSQEARFAFGRNWKSFLSVLSDSRIEQAEASLLGMLEVDDLRGIRFLDIGCGSGLFSLAARNLGANVTSFDYDADAVSCTKHLRDRFYPERISWQITQGSVLDQSFMEQLPLYDIVYSWGVLHHTGDMWTAIESACSKVKPHGKLFLSIYNRLPDRAHKRICKMKRSYVNARPIQKRIILACHGSRLLAAEMGSSVLQGKHPFATINAYNGDSRGMSFWHDIVDWIGGYPYEAARPEEIFDYCLKQGFQLMRLTTNPGHGCNQFIFQRNPVG